ncbi:MAG: hypothetical protein IPO87_14145 [Flavobacteriales bacterium]|nr:hypothetical protein [Flavobacteriales bacterium]
MTILNSFQKIKANYLAWLLLCSIFLFSASSKAQTTSIDPAGDGGFENGAAFAANGWRLIMVLAIPTNKWFVGTAPRLLTNQDTALSAMMQA